MSLRQDVDTLNPEILRGPYWSPDLAPTPVSARTWGLRDFAALWVAFGLHPHVHARVIPD